MEAGWGPKVRLTGGGGSGDPKNFVRPRAYAVDFYLNRQLAAQLKLLPVEGGGAS